MNEREEIHVDAVPQTAMKGTRTTGRPMWTTLWWYQRSVLANAHDVTGAPAREIADKAHVDRHNAVGALRHLRQFGLVDYRKDDRGQGQWVRTEYGNEVVQSWAGTQWEAAARRADQP